MKIRGEISQIRTDESFINLDSYFDLGVIAWTTAVASPTYLVKNAYTFSLAQFDNEEAAKEWLALRGEGIEVTRLDTPRSS